MVSFPGFGDFRRDLCRLAPMLSRNIGNRRTIVPQPDYLRIPDAAMPHDFRGGADTERWTGANMEGTAMNSLRAGPVYPMIRAETLYRRDAESSTMAGAGSAPPEPASAYSLARKLGAEVGEGIDDEACRAADRAR